jgi:hypothetical protein
MDNLKISIQKDLTALEEKLKAEGFEVVHFGKNDKDADVTLLTGINHDYEEIQNTSCHPNITGRGNLVVDVAEMEFEEILNIIKNKNKICNI